jgi:hexosaminidase
MGHPIDVAAFDRFEPLTADAEVHIIGMQGHIWSENARSKALLHHFVFPKLLGMAERAWAPKPAWEQMPVKDDREKEWSRFVTIVGTREFPRLAERGIQYRIPLPGGIVRNDTLYINNMFPGLNPMYQINRETSLEYHAPVFIPRIDETRITVWNRDRIGRESRKTELVTNQ